MLLALASRCLACSGDGPTTLSCPCCCRIQDLYVPGHRYGAYVHQQVPLLHSNGSRLKALVLQCSKVHNMDGQSILAYLHILSSKSTLHAFGT